MTDDTPTEWIELRDLPQPWGRERVLASDPSRQRVRKVEHSWPHGWIAWRGERWLRIEFGPTGLVEVLR
jgi:hypothetical protein